MKNKLPRWAIYVLVAFVSLAVCALVYVAARPARDDAGAIAYIDTSIPAIVQSWDSQQLVARAAPEILTPLVLSELPHSFARLAKLGKLEGFDPPVGNVSSPPIAKGGNGEAFAQYVVAAQFESGPAQIQITLRRRGRSWQILGFHIDSPTLNSSEE
jgi:hypothetical protein